MAPSLYVGRLPPNVQKADIEEHFKPYGRVVDVRLMSNFGFVEFENAEDVDAAAAALHDREFMGERLIVERSRDARKRDTYDGARGPPRVPRGRGVRVNIIGINSTTSWQILSNITPSRIAMVLHLGIAPRILHYGGRPEGVNPDP